MNNNFNPVPPSDEALKELRPALASWNGSVDHVSCTNCNTVQLAPITTDACMNCGEDGALVFVNEDKPDYGPGDYDGEDEPLEQGPHLQKAIDNALHG